MNSLNPKSRTENRYPAQRLVTQQDWDDLVLNDEAMKQVRSLEVWLKHRNVLLKDWGLARRVKPGYRVLFYGPPGTGKTLAASLLGKTTGREVYRFDLSLIASRFIGETEKSMASLFEKAESKNWILFFDEADALFGKRTDVKDAHDRYANQEISYLLQLIENFDGLIILASHQKSNLDPAFIRRLQSFIHFPPPKDEERFRLWQKIIPKQVKLSRPIDLKQVASDYQLNGAQIVEVVQHACLQAIARGEATIAEHDLLEGIQMEMTKAVRLPDEAEKQ